MIKPIKEIHTDSDLEACVHIIRSAFLTVAREFGLTEENAPTNPAFMTMERMKEYLEKSVKLFGLFHEEVLVGCVAVEASNDADTFYIERLAVDPGQRHRGYGDQLLCHAFAHIRDLKGSIASIGLMDNNKVLKEWYRSKGFVEKGIKEFAHLPFRVCFMSKELS